MKFDVKHIVAAAAFLAAGAHAATVTANVGDTWNGLTATGSASLTLSDDVVGALNVGHIALAGSGLAKPTLVQDGPDYVSATISAPLVSLAFDDVSHQVQAVGTTGGLTMTAAALKSVSTGGSLTVTDLSADLTNSTIYATLIGANGVDTLSHFALWNFSNISGGTIINGAGTYDNTLTGLVITADGFNKFSQALGLISTGKAALKGIADFGSISSTIVAIPAAASVPEPSTYALMGLGLVGIALTKRRKAA